MPRKTPLVFKNLSHQWARTVVSIGGLMLAIVLMFMQLGFLGAVGDTATSLYQKRMTFDLMVRSSDYLHLFEAASVDDSVLRTLVQHPSVQDARPLDTTLGGYRKILEPNEENPSEDEDEKQTRLRRTPQSRGIAILGIDPDFPAVKTPDLLRFSSLLSNPTNALIDRESHKDFIPKNGTVFSDLDVDSYAEVNGSRIRLAQSFEMGTGLAATGAIVVSRTGFQRLTGGLTRGKTSMVLVTLKSNENLLEDQKRLDDYLVQQGFWKLDVLRSEQVLRAEEKRWFSETPVGLIFKVGAYLAGIVGAVICYMVLASDVMAKLPEYATLKAIGYSNRYLSFLLIQQATMLAAFAYIPAFVLTLGLYWLTSYFANVDIEMTGPRMALVASASVAMCMTAGLLAVRKLAKAEPASLF
jgi:putative ABC transport system permease protein